MKAKLSRRNLISGMATAAVTRAALPVAATPVAEGHIKEPIDYVNPHMGGIGQLLSSTSPFAKLPYGVMTIAPITTPGVNDRYLADKIYGFPAGVLTLMPMSGAAETEPGKYASWYDHDLETVTPYYYAGILDDSDIKVEYTVSERAAYYRLTFPPDASARVLFSMPEGGEINLGSTSSVNGHGGSGRGGAARRGYFYAEFSNPVASSQTLTGLKLPRGGRQQAGATGRGIMANFFPGSDKRIGIRVGTSGFSIDQARRNLESEIPSWNFDRARAKARTIWNEALSKIAVKGGSEEQRTVFYTCLYRVLTSISNTAENDQYIGPSDHELHPAGGHGFNSGNGGTSMWGNYRSLNRCTCSCTRLNRSI